MLTITLYFSILLGSSLWAFQAEYTLSRKREILYRFALLLTLWIPAALRLNIGTDYPGYVYLYNYAEFGDIEPGYYFICKVLREINAGSIYMFALISLISYIPICFGVPKKGLFVSVYFFCCLFYLSTYSLIRQGAAVCLIWYASYALLEGKNIKFIIVLLLASTFHYSSLIILPFYFIKNMFSLNRKMIIIVLLTGTIGILNFNVIDKIFSSALFLDSHYGSYAMSQYNKETEMGSGLGVAIRLLIPVYSLYILPNIKDKIKGYGYILSLNIAYIFSYLLAIQIHIFNRLVDLLSFVPLLTIGIVVVNYKPIYRKLLIYTFITLNSLIFYKTIIGNDSRKGEGIGIYPYNSVLFNK